MQARKMQKKEDGENGGYRKRCRTTGYRTAGEHSSRMQDTRLLDRKDVKIRLRDRRIKTNLGKLKIWPKLRTKRCLNLKFPLPRNNVSHSCTGLRPPPPQDHVSGLDEAFIANFFRCAG